MPPGMGNDRGMRNVRLILLIVLALPGILPGATEPLGFFLTWKDDPCTTMVVDWHVAPGTEVPPLQFRKLGTSGWAEAKGTEGTFPFAERRLFREELAGLEPGSTYEFRFGVDGEVRTFRTIPATLAGPLKFAIGGDTRHQRDWLEKMNRVAASHDPEFAVLGGDLAYENGDPKSVNNVIEWFDAYQKTMVTGAGRAIPVIVVIGNHEVRGGFVTGEPTKALRAVVPPMSEDAIRAEVAPYFYHLFASPGQPGYRVLDFGKDLSLVLLDSNHTNPIVGEQARWLDETLSARATRPHVFPVYHVPAYPSVRPYDEPLSALVREHWVPLFEKHGVRLAFENHDHAFKRTHPIRKGKVDASGIVFLGDGAWGVAPREPHADSWYLAKSAGVRHGMLVTLDGPERIVEVFDEEGEIIDSFRSGPAPKAD